MGSFSCTDKVTNEQVLENVIQQESLLKVIWKRRLSWQEDCHAFAIGKGRGKYRNSVYKAKMQRCIDSDLFGNTMESIRR